MPIVLFETIIFYLLSSIYFFSLSGFGKLLINYNLQKNSNFNFFELFIFGLIVTTIVGFLLNISFGSNEYFNIINLLIGLLLFFFYKKEFNQINLRYIFLLLFLIFTTLLISKTHEDFVLYHLFSIEEIFNNELRIGVSKINFKFFHSSLLIYSQSLVIFPFLNYNLIHLPIFFIYFSVIGYFVYTLFNTLEKKERFFSLIIIMLLLIKFNRLSEYGYDYISQFLLFVVFHKVYFHKIDKDELIKSFTIFLFSILIKPITLLFAPILLFVLYKNNFKFLFEIFEKKISLFSFMIFILISTSFIRTGCLFYPINFSCFEEDKIFWSEKKRVKEYSEVVSLWAKSFYSSEESKYEKIKDKNIFKKNFNWLKFWIEGHFFYKISEFLLILIAIIILIHIYFTRDKPKFIKLPFEEYLILLLSFCSIIFWMITIPQFRFGFASIVVFVYLLFSNFVKLEINFDKKKIFILIFFSLLILNLKNLNRVKNEFEREDIYKFINFPFTNMKEISKNKVIDIDENKLQKTNFYHIQILK